MRRLPLFIHVVALSACLVTQAAPSEAQAMPGLRRAIEAIADPGKPSRAVSHAAPAVA